jgi:hypothetical protein
MCTRGALPLAMRLDGAACVLLDDIAPSLVRVMMLCS